MVEADVFKTFAMKPHELAREKHAEYLSRAAVADENAARSVGRQRERWIAAAKLWRGMAADLREIWKNSRWTRS